MRKPKSIKTKREKKEKKAPPLSLFGFSIP
jgi:hypothetical protein